MEVSERLDALLAELLEELLSASPGGTRGGLHDGIDPYFRGFGGIHYG
jgi:hypothetical protein